MEEFMKALKFTWIFALLTLFVQTTSFAQENRAVSHYNLQNGVGLKGYDPVSYFAEGGSSPQKGRTEFSLEHRGVTYMFANSENMKTFQTMPERYEPTYGGYCAWAMAQRRGSKVDIDPQLYTINGNRIHFFIVPSAKRNFDRAVARFEGRADRNWERITGEKPRL